MGHKRPDGTECGYMAEVFCNKCGWHVHSEAVDVPERAPTIALCERYGYGAVMGAAARAWKDKDPVGALTVGPCACLVAADLAALLAATARAEAAEAQLAAARQPIWFRKPGRDLWLLFDPVAAQFVYGVTVERVYTDGVWDWYAVPDCSYHGNDLQAAKDAAIRADALIKETK